MLLARRSRLLARRALAGLHGTLPTAAVSAALDSAHQPHAHALLGGQRWGSRSVTSILDTKGTRIDKLLIANRCVGSRARSACVCCAAAWQLRTRRALCVRCAHTCAHAGARSRAASSALRASWASSLWRSSARPTGTRRMWRARTRPCAWGPRRRCRATSALMPSSTPPRRRARAR
jgi:hypothetical protein